MSRNANTSFVSTVPSVFSQNEQNFSFKNTQTTAPDVGFGKETRDSFTTVQADKYVSSDYQSSSFEAHVIDLPEDEIINDLPRPPNPADKELSQDLLGVALETEPAVDDMLSEDQLEAEKWFKEKLEGIFRKSILSSVSKHVLI